MRGHAGANRDRHEWDPTSSLPALDAQDTRPQVISENGWYPSVVAPSPAAKRASRSRTGCLRIPHRYAVLWPYCHILHDLLVLFAMQVARSLRIRSRYLAMPAGKARRSKRSCTQRPEATSGCMPIRACCQSVECTQIPVIVANKKVALSPLGRSEYEKRR